PAAFIAERLRRAAAHGEVNDFDVLREMRLQAIAPAGAGGDGGVADEDNAKLVGVCRRGSLGFGGYAEAQSRERENCRTTSGCVDHDVYYSFVVSQPSVPFSTLATVYFAASSSVSCLDQPTRAVGFAPGPVVLYSE